MQLLNLETVLVNNLNRPLRQLIVRYVQLIQRMNFLVLICIHIKVVHVDKHTLQALVCDLVVD